MSVRKLRNRRSGHGERGHLMVAVMVAVAILGIFSAMAVQSWAEVKRRDDEAEMMFRAQEISRAIIKYNRDKGPLLEFEDLAESGSRGQYFLRQLYDDPLTRNGKWGMIYAGPDGGIYDPNSATGSAGLELGGQQPLEGYGGLGTDAGSSGPGAQPQQAAGLPIIGVKTLSTDKPFRTHKGLNEYAQWLFTIRDLQPMGQQQQGGQGNPGTSPQSPSQPPQNPLGDRNRNR